MRNKKIALLPAGKYYIGDPCYIFAHDTDSWDKVLEQTSYFGDRDGGGVFTIFGQTVVGGSTAHGDGMYYDYSGRPYAVDAGVIAIMPISLLEIDKYVTEEEIIKSDCMQIVEFKEPFRAEYVDGGTYHFGDEVTIVTGEEDEEEEDDEDDSWFDPNY